VPSPRRARALSVPRDYLLDDAVSEQQVEPERPEHRVQDDEANELAEGDVSGCWVAAESH
jgi:hypothetical protein